MKKGAKVSFLHSPSHTVYWYDHIMNKQKQGKTLLCYTSRSLYLPTLQCGHWAPPSKMVDRMHRRQGFSLECPHCGESVSFIRDSGVTNKGAHTSPLDQVTMYSNGRSVRFSISAQI